MAFKIVPVDQWSGGMLERILLV